MALNAFIWVLEVKNQLFNNIVVLGSLTICDRLRENRAQRSVHKYREKIDRFL